MLAWILLTKLRLRHKHGTQPLSHTPGFGDGVGQSPWTGFARCCELVKQRHSRQLVSNLRVK